MSGPRDSVLVLDLVKYKKSLGNRKSTAQRSSTNENIVSPDKALGLMNFARKKKPELLGSLTKEDFDFLSTILSVLSISNKNPQGEKIITQGAAATFALVVLKGVLDVFQNGELAYTAEAGDVLGSDGYFAKMLRMVDVVQRNDGKDTAFIILSYEEVQQMPDYFKIKLSKILGGGCVKHNQKLLSMRETSQDKEKIYKEILRVTLADGKMSPDDLKKLEAMQAAYNIDKKAHVKILGEIGVSTSRYKEMTMTAANQAEQETRDLYLRVLSAFMADDVISIAEQHELVKIRINYKISEAMHKSVLQELKCNQDKWNKMIERGRGDIEEDEETVVEKGLELYRTVLEVFLTNRKITQEQEVQLEGLREKHHLTQNHHFEVLSALGFTAREYEAILQNTFEKQQKSEKVMKKVSTLEARQRKDKLLREHLKSKEKALEKEVEEAKSARGHAESQNRALQNKFRVYQATLKKTETELEKSKEELKGARNENKATIEELMQSEKKYRQECEENLNLLHSLKQSKQELEDLRSQHDAQLNTIKSTVTTAVSKEQQEYKAKYEERNSRVQDLEKDLHLHKSILEEAKTAHKQVLREIDTHKEEKEEAHNRLTQVELQSSRREKRLRAYVEDLDKAQMRITELETRLKDAYEKIEWEVELKHDAHKKAENAMANSSKMEGALSLEMQKRAMDKTQRTHKLTLLMKCVLVHWSRSFKTKRLLAASVLTLEKIKREALANTENRHHSFYDTRLSTSSRTTEREIRRRTKERLAMMRRAQLLQVADHVQATTDEVERSFLDMQKSMEYWKKVANEFFQRNIELVKRQDPHAAVDHYGELKQSEDSQSLSPQGGNADYAKPVTPNTFAAKFWKLPESGHSKGGSSPQSARERRQRPRGNSKRGSQTARSTMLGKASPAPYLSREPQPPKRNAGRRISPKGRSPKRSQQQFAASPPGDARPLVLPTSPQGGGGMVAGSPSLHRQVQGYNNGQFIMFPGISSSPKQAGGR